jgi:hypothetical protein
MVAVPCSIIAFVRSAAASGRRSAVQTKRVVPSASSRTWAAPLWCE